MEKPTALYFVRHGQTDWNVIGRTQGRYDIPLNEVGRAAAREVGRRLSQVPFDRAYCSPLSRARETAEIILQLHERPVPLGPDPRLAEIDFGVWEGMTVPEIEADYGTEWHNYRSNPLEYGPPEGESVPELMKRIDSFINTITEEVPGSTVLVVSHGAWLRNCFYGLFGLDYGDPGLLRVDNTGISIIHFRGRKPQLVLFNDVGRIR